MLRMGEQRPEDACGALADNESAEGENLALREAPF